MSRNMSRYAIFLRGKPGFRPTIPSCLRQRCWDSNTASAATILTRWCFGKHSSAISPTAHRSSLINLLWPERTNGDCFGVVMLLPHGYEGQGPEHSSGRIERYLQLAAKDNIQICQPSTAGQYFHLLRRQALRKWRKPLVVMTPKSMLRTPASSSTLAELSAARFRPVIPDKGNGTATRVLLCTGKIGHELEAERKRRKDDSTAIVFVEQLYPFPEAELAAEMDRHANAREFVWVQEEP